MSFVGRLTFKVIQESFIDLTPIIAKIYAYPKWDLVISDNTLCLHFVTDDGDKNTVMSRLWRRADGKLQEAYAQERAYALYDLCYYHTGPAPKLPPQAQLIYQRHLMSSGLGESK